MSTTTTAAPASVSTSIIPMGLDEVARQLIYRAIPSAGVIQVAPLDKGLSGAAVWLTEWSMEYGVRSAPHVLKIDEFAKLQAEKDRVDEYVAAVDPATGHIALFGPEPYDGGGKQRGLLRQAYIGNSDGGPISLRTWIQKQTADYSLHGARTIEHRQQAVRDKVAQLYSERMRPWNAPSPAAAEFENSTLGDQLARRIKHLDKLKLMIDTLGLAGLERSLGTHALPNLHSMQEMISDLLKQSDDFAYGLIHGDLHSQNVLVDDKEKIHLIDFAWAGYGWRALDFLMLECSLKFLVVPNDAEVSDLLKMERLVDDWPGEHESFTDLDDCICAAELRIIAAAISEVRRLAMDLTAVRDRNQYRRGLIALSATLGGFPQLHRTFLIHSLCYHAGRIS